MIRNSACYQKIDKISPVVEDDFFQSILSDVIQDLRNLTEVLCETLSKLKMPVTVPNSPNEITSLVSSLSYMIPLLCDYSTTESHQITLKSPDSITTEISVTVRTSEDIIGRIFECPPDGLFLSQNDCKDLASLVIGAIRDSSSADLKKQVKKLEEKAIGLGKAILAVKKKII